MPSGSHHRANGHALRRSGVGMDETQHSVTRGRGRSEAPLHGEVLDPDGAWDAEVELKWS